MLLQSRKGDVINQSDGIRWNCWNNFCAFDSIARCLGYWWITRPKLRVSQISGSSHRNKHDLPNARSDTEPLPLSGWTKRVPTGYSRRDVFCMRILHVVHPATRIAQIRPFVIPTSVRESHLLPYRYKFMCKPIDYQFSLPCILYDLNQSNVIFLSHAYADLEILIGKNLF